MMYGSETRPLLAYVGLNLKEQICICLDGCVAFV